MQPIGKNLPVPRASARADPLSPDCTRLTHGAQIARDMPEAVSLLASSAACRGMLRRRSLTVRS